MRYGIICVLLFYTCFGICFTFLSGSLFFVDVYASVVWGDWVMPGSVVDLFFCWYHRLGKHSFDIWNLVLDCLMWTIWTKQTRRSFEDKGKTVVQLVDLC